MECVVVVCFEMGLVGVVVIDSNALCVLPRSPIHPYLLPQFPTSQTDAVHRVMGRPNPRRLLGQLHVGLRLW